MLSKRKQLHILKFPCIERKMQFEIFEREMHNMYTATVGKYYLFTTKPPTHIEIVSYFGGGGYIFVNILLVQLFSYSFTHFYTLHRRKG